MMTAKEVLELTEVLMLLKPLEAATREIEGQKYRTSSLVIPVTYILEHKVSTTSPNENIGKEFHPAEKVHVLSVATLFDPRCKKVYFRDPINCAKAVEIINRLIREVSSSEKADVGGEDPSMMEVGKLNTFIRIFGL